MQSVFELWRAALSNFVLNQAEIDRRQQLLVREGRLHSGCLCLHVVLSTAIVSATCQVHEY